MPNLAAMPVDGAEVDEDLAALLLLVDPAAVDAAVPAVCPATVVAVRLPLERVEEVPEAEVAEAEEEVEEDDEQEVEFAARCQ